ncbi:MAG TPA: menaquinone biosynthesis protein [Fibrobacteraceae bacterium]|jgi:chorismate dehydratase|nr:menaquinone biosynthesis protein [Fibrobacter sp.]HOG68093.1 menaquinone biosynthesis protein [Fibrobacteraceae bacterium]HPW93690.1 menaquinone biosynthesis protein [Fibrobacteraceae bacterium]HQB64459.1 menaquinone biosynthesis protein [Fibrobacteraceae bacterium]
MNLNIGRIPFLVCAPFFYNFFTKNENFPNFLFIDGTPRAHNEALNKNIIDLAPASSITFAKNPELFLLSPKLCTSCRFEVQSVKLFSQRPLLELNQKNIHLTNQSDTSIALLDILLSLRFHITPTYIRNRAYDPKEDVARLLIGDQALLETYENHFSYSYDLASLWEEWQHLPFVFGAWIIHKNALVKEKKDLLDLFLTATEENVNSFRKSPKTAIETWLKNYPVQLPARTIFSYYDSLDYSFTSERKESLELFFSLCHQRGIIPTATKLKFI